MIESIPAPQRKALEEGIPLGRWGDPDEITAGVMFLASPAAGYVTGTVLPVDGGIAM
jgi:3-oxoacyl-[acyl-carrier protein] reductase